MARVKLTVVVQEAQAEWLKEHSEINVSGLLQKAIEDLMKKERV